jgi:hypothetical protein
MMGWPFTWLAADHLGSKKKNSILSQAYKKTGMVVLMPGLKNKIPKVRNARSKAIFQWMERSVF